MNKKLFQTINDALGRVKTARYSPATIDSFQTRLSEELDWIDEDPGRECLIILLQQLAARMRSARIVVSPGYRFLPDSLLLFLTGVTRINPVEWDLPFAGFTKFIHNGATIPFKAGSGSLEAAREALLNRENEMVAETEPGLYEITFLDGMLLRNVKLRIFPDSTLDRFAPTLKKGWHPLDEATLNLFRSGDTKGSIWFDSDKIREWLVDFNPESMSDLALLIALQDADSAPLFQEVLARKWNPDYADSLPEPETFKMLRDTYGVPVYQEQTILIAGRHDGKEIPTDYKLAMKGHCIGRAMMEVETLWPFRHKNRLNTRKKV